MPRRWIARALTLGLAALAALAIGAWGWRRLTVLPPIPPAPPDEGQEARLHQAYLEALVERRPEHWQARVNLGSLLTQQGRPVAALAHLRQAARQRPGDLHILRGMAVTADESGLIDEQVRAWQALARADRTDVHALVRLSSLYRQLSWNGLSLAAANDALRLAPRDPDALRVHAILDFVGEDYQTAIRLARRLTQLDPGNPVGHSILGRCFRAQGRWDEAFAAAEEAARAAPGTIDYRVDLARLHLDRPEGARYDRAIQLLSKPASDPAAELERRYWLGVSQLKAGALDAALADLGWVYRQQPRYQEVAHHLQQVHQQKGDTERALAYSREYQQTLMLRHALRDAEAALRRDMASAELHLRVARAALALGESSRAALESRAALRFRPGYPEATRVLREALSRMGRADEAGA